MLVRGGVWVGVTYLKQPEDIGHHNGHSASGGSYHPYYRLHGGVDQVPPVLTLVVAHVKAGQPSLDEVHALLQGVGIGAACVQNMYP